MLSLCRVLTLIVRRVHNVLYTSTRDTHSPGCGMLAGITSGGMKMRALLHVGLGCEAGRPAKGLQDGIAGGVTYVTDGCSSTGSVDQRSHGHPVVTLSAIQWGPPCGGRVQSMLFCAKVIATAVCLMSSTMQGPCLRWLIRGHNCFVCVVRTCGTDSSMEALLLSSCRGLHAWHCVRS